MEDESWRVISQEIRDVAKPIVLANKFDDAIFAAFRYVEGEIQDRIGSRSIGVSLLNEAFDGTDPKIKFSDDARDAEGIKKLFEGALGNIRNDRGHKKAPLLPCAGLTACLQHLAFASLLLYLLSKDRNAYPQIQSIRVFGSRDQPRLELSGQNFSSGDRVLASESDLPIVRLSSHLIEAVLPADYAGPVVVVAENGSSNEVYCDTKLVEGRVENRYEVLSTEIPLYSDPNCITRREEVVGMLLRATEAGRSFPRILPTRPKQYKAGCYVTHGPYESESIGETWYRDPDTNEITYAWTGSTVAKPDVLGSVNEWNLGAIELLPRRVKTESREARTLTVLGWEVDGKVRRTADYTTEAKWESEDTDICFCKQGVLYPKRQGRTTIRCSVKGFHASAEVTVGHFSFGERAIYYQGLRRLQQIRFDENDNLYLCNQSESVFRLNASGGIERIFRVAALEDRPHGIDCLAVDKERNVYVNGIGQRHILRFKWNGSSYDPPKAIGLAGDGTRKGICVDDVGHVFIAVMAGRGKGYVLHVAPNGEEKTFETLDSAIDIAIDPQDRLCVPAKSESAVHVYSRSGEVLEVIPYDFPDSASDIAIDSSGRIYLTMFHSGALVRVDATSGEIATTVLDTGFHAPSGVALDSNGRAFVSNFSGDRVCVDVVYV